MSNFCERISLEGIVVFFCWFFLGKNNQNLTRVKLLLERVIIFRIVWKKIVAKKIIREQLYLFFN